MPIKEEGIVPGTKVKWKGAFDFDLLYRKMKDWLQVESWSDVKESLYVERVKPDGKQIEIIWDTTKNEEEDYFGYKLNIVFRGTRLNPVETVKDGKKLKLMQGTIEITFKATLIHDVDDKFKDSPKKGQFYEKYFMSDNIDKNQIELYDKTLDLIDMVKDFLSLYSF
jgi:hypothetical protein